MSKKAEKDAFNIDPFFLFVLLPILFLIPFLSSYFLTNSYLERKEAVSLEEEAFHFEKVINLDELNILYGKNYSSSTLPKDKVVILGYHQIRNIEESDNPKARLFITSPEVFEKEMEILKNKGYTSISVTEYLNYLNNRILNKIPEKSVVITFDDGYISQYSNAFPILKKYGMKATLFLYMDCIHKYSACMNTEQIKEMIEEGFTVANHTLRHIFLTEYKDGIVEKEILDNQKLLEEKFGKKNVEKVLAYPYGLEDERIREIVKNLGYIGAVGVTGGVEIDNQNTFNLHRYLMGDKIEFFEELFKS